MAGDTKRKAIHVEILQKRNSILTNPEVISLVEDWLNSTQEFEDVITEFDNPQLNDHISRITIDNKHLLTNGSFYKLCHHIYRFNSSSPDMEEAEREQPISTQWLLPTKDFHGLWESLIFDDDKIKNELFSYASTALRFSEKNIDPMIISCNRIALLHGPPGSGKTSLCKALAQKLSIHLNSKFQYGHFIEVNIDSLFSKWFSESGKLISKLFQNITTLLEDPRALVIVLLDEIESLARSRAASLHGNDPSDALRVVNSLLTHLDRIKKYPNVLIFTTSNITDALDVAFVDRADIKQYVGLPCIDAIYQIYYTCVKELLKAESIVNSDRQSDWIYCSLKALDEAMERLGEVTPNTEKLVTRMTKLRLIVELSVGLSGRDIRRIPLMAYGYIEDDEVTVEDILEALSKAVQKCWNDIKRLKLDV